jgi:hypothetical protein
VKSVRSEAASMTTKDPAQGVISPLAFTNQLQAERFESPCP